MHSGFERNAADIVAEVSRREVEPGRPLVGDIASALQRRGWRREIAGDDFDAAAYAAAKAFVNGRGLLVGGAFGSGKTALVDALTKATVLGRTTLKVNLGDPEDAERLDSRIWPNWNAGALERNVFLDDLGSESIVSEYGSFREAAGDFIVRYHAKGRGLLFLTTNLGPKELEARYTMRVMSRILDRTVPLVLHGADKRTIMTAERPAGQEGGAE